MSDIPLPVAVAAFSALLVIIGSCGPWITTPFGSRGALDGDGLITLLVGVVALLAVIATREDSGVFALAGGVLAGVVAVIDGIDTLELVSDTDGLASVGWGLVILALGSVLLAATGLGLLRGGEPATPLMKAVAAGAAIVGVLVFIAIGSSSTVPGGDFGGPSNKAKDANAKSDVRNAVSQVESCYVDATSYEDCQTGSPGLDGSTTGSAVVEAEGNQYQVTAKSESGTEFTISKTGSGGNFERTCSDPGEGGCSSSGDW